MHKNMAFLLSKFNSDGNRLCVKNAGYANFYHRENVVIGCSYKVRNGDIRKRIRKFTGKRKFLEGKGNNMIQKVINKQEKACNGGD